MAEKRSETVQSDLVIGEGEERDREIEDCIFRERNNEIVREIE